MPFPPAPTWGHPTLFLLDTNQVLPIHHTPAGATCRLEFGRELVCELRPHGAELEGHWRFGLHQLLALPADTPATVRYALHLFVYKPAGTEVMVQLKTPRAVQALHGRPEAVLEGEQQLTLTAPLALTHGGLPLWLTVTARRAAGAGQVLVTLDALAVALEAAAASV